MEDNLLYREEVYQIIGAAMEVHKELGNGFLESVYEEAMRFESQTRSIPFQTHVRLAVYYKNQPLSKEFIADYIAYEKIIVEFKCISSLTAIEEAQLFNYLKATGFKVGLLINFGSKGKLEWKRFIK